MDRPGSASPPWDAYDAAAALVATPTGALVVPGASSATGQLQLSVIVPTFNEATNVVELARALSDALEAPLEGSFEILFVDDDSPDRTWRVALAAAAALPRVRVMRRVGERSLSTAVIRGWQAARADVLAVIDGDLQHPPEIMADLFRVIGSGADLAVASRHVPGGGVSDWSLFRRFVSRGAQLLGLALLPDVMGRVSDPMSGYFMVKRSAISERELAPLGYKLLVEVLARGDVRLIGEVAYVFRERALGGSKADWKVYAEYVRHLARLRRRTR